MVKDSKALLKMAEEHPGAVKTIINKVKEIIAKIQEFLAKHKNDYYEIEVVRNLKENQKALQKVVDLYDKAVIEGIKNQNTRQAVKDNSGQKNNRPDIDRTDVMFTDDNVKYSSERISAGMSDKERTDILRNKVIKNIGVVKQTNLIDDWDNIDKLLGKEKRSLIQKIAQEFRVFKEYTTSDFKLSFNFSKNNYRESYGKQKRNFQQFAKMFSVFDEVIESSIGVEVHNRNNYYKTDATLENVYVLFSAFEDGKNIIPVKLEVKEFKDKPNTLYVAVSLEAIKKTEVSKQGTTENGVAQNSRSVTYSICDLFKKINPKDIDFIKYLPNELLTQEQIKAKKRYESNSTQFSVRDNRTDITSEDVKILQSIAKSSGKISINDFTSEQIQQTEKWARKFYRELGTKSPYFRAWFGDWRENDKNLVKAISIAQNTNLNKNNRTVYNKDTKWDIKITKDVFNDSLHYAKKEKIYLERLLTNIDDVVKNAVLFDTSISESSKHNKKGSSQFMHYLYSIVEYNGNPFLAKITVEEYGDNSTKRAYNIQRIKMSTLSRAQYSQIKSAYRGKFASNVDGITVADLFVLVKQYDNKFNPKSVNPILLNEDGTPKVFYHGTNKIFTEFKPEEIAHREGSYFFAENREDAEAYGGNVYEVFLSGNKLADYNNQPSEFYKLKDKREQVEYLKKQGYDGWYADMDSEGWGEVSVFNPTQIKSATDNIGTFDKDNTDIRFSIERGRELSDDELIERAVVKSEQAPDFEALFEDEDLSFDFVTLSGKERFEKLLKDNPTLALDTVYSSFANAILKKFNISPRMPEVRYNYTVKKILSDYNIEPTQKAEFEEILRKFIGAVNLMKLS